jgi:predicted phosphoadenosine phosphosulfate sulfurtransferase
MKTKLELKTNVFEESKSRISWTFDVFDKIAVSFSGGKDSTVMMHLVCEEAQRRSKKVGVMIVDLEAQYSATIDHIETMIEKYKDCIDLHWVCLPISLSNAVSNFEPRWKAWDQDKKEVWVRDYPKRKVIKDFDEYPFYADGMEFEEFVPLWAKWYAQGETLGVMVGIRADESLNRFRTICTFDKETFQGRRFTTGIYENVFNVYPIYDWRTRDIWVYHAKFKDMEHNKIYDLMNKAGVPLSQQRLCQPYGHDQRKGLWLYHILEPQTWYKLLCRVNGVNSGALYIQENGNITGVNKIYKPKNHTWESFTKLIFATMPKITREHYASRFKTFIEGWKGRGYSVIPDEAPLVLENAHWAPSWRRMCKVLLRNDWWCKGLGLTQPKSEAYGKYLEIKKLKKQREAISNKLS